MARSLNNPLESTISELRKDIAALSSDVSALKPVGEIIKYLLFFWAAISALLGLVGFSQLSDVGSQVDAKVNSIIQQKAPELLDRSKALSETVDVLTKKIEEFDLSLQKLNKMKSDFEGSEAFIRYSKVLSEEFDIEGKILRIITEADDEKNRSDQKWRAETIGVLETFMKELDKKSYDSELMFNVSQTCRQLGLTELGQKVAKSNPSQSNLALSLTFDVAQFVGEKRTKAYMALLDMVRNLSDENPQIVLAEAWNSTETLRNYTAFVDALDSLIKTRNNNVPSIVFLIKSRTHIRRSWEEDLDRSKELLMRGIHQLSRETSNSSWYDSSVKEISALADIIQKTIESQKFYSGMTSN